MSQQTRILSILEDGLWHSTREIMDRTGIGYPPRRIHELRKAGHNIVSKKGEHWDEYRLEPRVAPIIREPLVPHEFAPSTQQRLGLSSNNILP